MAYFSFSQKILAGKAIDVYNFGKMMRDFTYIDDIVVGIIHALDKIRRFEIINIGADKPEKLSKFISVLEENLGRKAKKNYLPIQPGDVPRTMADVRKLRKLGWKPTTRIEQGIASFVEWYKEYYHIA
jgi:UDP-glucuronate 4-epimerase